LLPCQSWKQNWASSASNYLRAARVANSDAASAATVNAHAVHAMDGVIGPT